MKKKLVPFILFPLIFMACTKEFNPNGPFTPKTIVYSLLDPTSSVHYVRVQKAFLDANTNALTIADINDSIYYPANLVVQLNGNGNYFTLTRVSGDSFNVIKDDGIFSNSPNILYRINTTLIAGKRYTVNILSDSRPEENASATVTLVEPAQGVYPMPSVTVNLADTNGVALNFKTGKYAVFYQIVFRLHYKEWLASDPTHVEYKYIDWVASNNELAPDSNGGDLVKLIVPARNIYRQLHNSLAIGPDYRRQYDDAAGLEVLYYGGGQALYDYIRVKNAQGGLTANEALSPYTNVGNGLGVVSSRSLSKTSGVQITQAAIDSLSCGSITNDLNFANSSGLFFNCPD